VPPTFGSGSGGELSPALTVAHAKAATATTATTNERTLSDLLGQHLPVRHRTMERQTVEYHIDVVGRATEHRRRESQDAAICGVRCFASVAMTAGRDNVLLAHE